MVQEREPPIGRFYSRLQFNFLVSSVPGARTLQQPHEWSDPWVAETVVSRAFQPDHLNLDCVGNTVPHLHMGIILRYRSAPRWALPIWTMSRENMHHGSMKDDECESLAQVLRDSIANAA